MSRSFLLIAALLTVANFAAPATICHAEQVPTEQVPTEQAPASEPAKRSVDELPAKDSAAVADDSSAQDAATKATAEADQARIETLEKTLSGATLAGRFTDSSQPDASPRAERYELAAVKHLGQNQWLFKARIRYGNHDITLPMTLPILWAGDTPVITVENLPVVGLGTFNARVMIYQDHYAGIWSGSDHHGHIYGTVEPPKEAEPRKPVAEESKQ